MTVTTDERLWHLAVTTLEDNWWHDHTVPSQTLYPHQWSWDTGFIVVGLARVNPGRAWRDLRHLFSAQWADGRVPHIVFDPRNGRRTYFPGPDFWRSSQAPGAPDHRETSGIVQPPVHAIAAWELYRAATDPDERARAAEELTWLYPRLVAQQRYLARHRDLGGAGLVSLLHPWESGQDNSPAWDAALANVPADPEVMRHRKRVDLVVADREHRPTDDDYVSYLTIAQAYRDRGYRDGSAEDHLFVVECPAFNALMVAAEYALAEIATVTGHDPTPHRERAAELTDSLVKRLFNPTTGMFHALDVRTGTMSPARYAGGLVPLVLPELPQAQVEALIAEASSPRFGLSESMTLPLPSYDRTAPDLDPDRYWRGPIWINMNWLMWRALRQHGRHALAAELRRCTVDLVRRSGCYEYFHAVTGEGIGTTEFSWTAALVLDLLAAEPD